MLPRALACLGLVLAACVKAPGPQQRADTFLETYTGIGQKLYAVTGEAYWKAATDVKPEHTGQRIGASEAYAAFAGSEYVINTARALLDQRAQLDDITVRQLEKILLDAAEYPGTAPELVEQRIRTEAEAGAILDSFEFCLSGRPAEGAACADVVTPNQIDSVLRESRDLGERQDYWEASKQTGPALKDKLVELRDQRNKLAQELGYSSFFALQIADYGMSVEEMSTLMEQFLTEMEPLYGKLHAYAKSELSSRYGAAAPDGPIPAHWMTNRWAQQWPGLSEAADLDGLFADKDAEYIVRQSEEFYKSLGMEPLPASFYERSDLYALPPGAERKKNTHASAWHIDRGADVRSLMSVEPNFQWWETSHHELGHVYYYMAYTRPEVPFMLRAGANRAFHEAIGDLIGIAARQPRYLKEIGLMPEDQEVDQNALLLDEALHGVVFLPFSAGTMTFFERDLYEGGLAKDEFNARWWEHVERFQRVSPPSERGEEYCDACTKTHITDDPAQYYDYAMAYVIKYQLHTYIAENILKQDPRDCNYYGNKEVGAFLMNLLQLGATRDWREVMREVTGEDVSTRAMVEYFSPLLESLD